MRVGGGIVLVWIVGGVVLKGTTRIGRIVKKIANLTGKLLQCLIELKY